MDAIILVGGLGTRLRDVISNVPKPMAPVGGRPFLDFILAQLDGFGGVPKVVLAVGYKAESIQRHYVGLPRYGFEIAFSVESSPLGTGGAILQSLEHTNSPDILVLNGDSFVEFELTKLAAAHREKHADVSMIVTKVDDVGRYGSVTIDPATSRVLKFREKDDAKGAGFINAGCYLIRRSAIELLPAVPSSFEKDILPRFLDSTYASVVTGKFIDIGLPETYRAAEAYLHATDPRTD